MPQGINLDDLQVPVIRVNFHTLMRQTNLTHAAMLVVAQDLQASLYLLRQINFFIFSLTEFELVALLCAWSRRLW
jgi:hypothetical protein